MQFYNYRRKRKRRFHSSFSSGYKYPRKRKPSHHRKRKRGFQKRLIRVLAAVCIVFVVLAAAGTGTFLYLKESGKRSLMQAANTSQPEMGEHQEESGLVSRDGKKYKYNEDIINILCMGIDKSSDLSDEAAASGENGQADTIFLLTLDQKEKKMALIGLSRDTMTAIRTYDHQGNYVGETTNHLGLAYAFGDGKEESGRLMTEAVSKLLYEMPIHGYVAVNMNAIQKMNDSVGGVQVTLTEDMVLNGEEFAKGKTLRLSGEQAHSFVRMRDMMQEGSNNLRMERQKQYALSFINEAKREIKKDITLVAALYQDLSEDMVTSIGLDETVYLASLLPEISFQMDDIRMVQGEIRQGSVYEEFYADEDALLDLILEVFYTEVG